MDYNRRLSALEAQFTAKGLDSFFVTSDINVSYLSGFLGHDSMLLVTPDKRYLITDSRYIEEASRTVAGFEIALVEKSVYDTVKDIAMTHGLKKLGFESMDMPYGAACKLKNIIKPCRFVEVKGLVKGMRAIKDAEETALIKKSVVLLKDVYKNIEPRIKAGASEESLARDIEIGFIDNGAKAAFDPIIASGRNASKPHARPSPDRLAKDDMVMVDIGCSLSGYNTDMTRMVILGKVKPKLKEIYTIVRDAQLKAIEAVKPGARIAAIDDAARSHITKKGYGKHFGHATGHGIGLEVHEDPTVSCAAEGKITSGMVFTIEPAIYLPGVGGVRIEDMVLVTDKGCEILTK
jgi:Xaa-Pro aminopeptidase